MVCRSVATNRERVDPSFITSHAVLRSDQLVRSLTNACEVANCFQRHCTLCQFGAMLFSKQDRLSCCRLEMRSRSRSYNSINSNHSACARMALNIDSKQVHCHFSSHKHPKSQIQILRIHKMEGGGMLSFNMAKCVLAQIEITKSDFFLVWARESFPCTYQNMASTL
jgi:hypothetical protein